MLPLLVEGSAVSKIIVEPSGEISLGVSRPAGLIDEQAPARSAENGNITRRIAQDSILDLHRIPGQRQFVRIKTLSHQGCAAGKKEIPICVRCVERRLNNELLLFSLERCN